MTLALTKPGWVKRSHLLFPVQERLACLTNVSGESPAKPSGEQTSLTAAEKSNKYKFIVYMYSFIRNIKVLVMEVKGLRSLSANKIVYCTMELEGSGKLQTDQAEASKPCWDTQGDFTTNQPLPSVKIKLCMETQGLLSLDDKELGRVILNPTVTTLKNPEWCDMTPARNCPDKNLKIKVACKMDKPQNMKHSGWVADQDKTLKHSLEEMAQADPCKFNHSDLFSSGRWSNGWSRDGELKKNPEEVPGKLDVVEGWFNPGQIFVLDEYCARYGVRGCHRHLSYLSDLLHHSEQALSFGLTVFEPGLMIDPTLMHYSFAFCASHTHGNRPDGMGTVLHEERDRFLDMKERLRLLLEYQITNFRWWWW
ncbi:hypothetical protein HELRODRAFT_179173 [Helobdella robusta]|uniref:CAPS C2 domain-containing protein n=1 Tax=Helobdella robusta TaxID=6412 RepID=T1FEA9_HELRO|nr:hypothetical protein HELRODRAFT_179173 [Helobdella robusta]ESN95698.1 hypothetical protein HELRODRAFT_179173 [Helobdella robusta]